MNSLCYNSNGTGWSWDTMDTVNWDGEVATRSEGNNERRKYHNAKCY